MPNEEKLKKLLSELQRLKAVKDGGPMAGVAFDLLNKVQQIKGDTGHTPQRGVDYMTQSEFDKFVKDITTEVKSLIRMPQDGKDGKDGVTIVGPRGPKGDRGEKGIGLKGDKGDKGLDGSPDTPRMIKNKLESIKEEDNKLSIDAIKNLRKELDELRKEAKNKGTFFGGGGDRKHSKQYDLSSQLNGVTKTFSLPAFWEVTGVVTSSFPNALRPIIDYTTNAGLMTITFTSQIDAQSTLAEGQTVIVFYQES